nr:pirin-like protein 2 isoform X1 [Chelonoidis abingdonii]
MKSNLQLAGIAVLHQIGSSKIFEVLETASSFRRMVTLRKVIKTVLSIEQAEGVGARVRRSIGRPELKNVDPFLLLDEFKGGKPAGFPDHPHRGFETADSNSWSCLEILAILETIFSPPIATPLQNNSLQLFTCHLSP